MTAPGRAVGVGRRGDPRAACTTLRGLGKALRRSATEANREDVRWQNYGLASKTFGFHGLQAERAY